MLLLYKARKTSQHWSCYCCIRLGKPVNIGHVIAVLGFADKIHREYEHISWYKIEMLLCPLAVVLYEVDFNLELFRKSFANNVCNIL